MSRRWIIALMLLLTVVASGCFDDGAGDAEAGAEEPIGTESNAAASDGEPEQTDLSIVYFPSGVGIPVMIASEEGYYEEEGLNVELSQLGSSAATQALAAGEIDMYFGGASAVSAKVAGFDILYAGAAVDTPPVKIMARPDIEDFTDLQDGLVATTGAGAFGEIVIRALADEHDMSVDKGDVNLIYNRNNEAAVAQLIEGNVDAAIVTAPAYLKAEAAGFEMLIDVAKDTDHKIVGPGLAVQREWMEQNPNTIKAFIRAQLRGVKTALEDPDLAKETFTDVTGTTNQDAVNTAYEANRSLWNVDFTVTPEPIELVLNYTPALATVAQNYTAEEFYDNSLVWEVNEEYAPELFPDEEFRTGP